MQVIATATGYDNVAVRNEGDVFTCPKNAKGEDIIGKKADGSPKVSWYKEYEPGGGNPNRTLGLGRADEPKPVNRDRHGRDLA